MLQLDPIPAGSSMGNSPPFGWVGPSILYPKIAWMGMNHPREPWPLAQLEDQVKAQSHGRVLGTPG